MRMALGSLVAALVVSGCDGLTSVEGDGGATGGGASGGGVSGVGGGSAGGSAVGGGDAGGDAGGSAAGGSAAGGSAAGGSAAGGSAGGSAAGGSAAGGSAAGGSAAGGSAAGGSAAGGSAAGGSAAGGSAAGGSTAGGSAAGGSAAGGSAAGGGYVVVNDGGFGLLSRPANPTCVAPARPPSAVQVVRAFTGISFAAPIALAQGASDPGRIYILEKAGRVRAFPNVASVTTAQVTTPLDFSTLVNNSFNEGGALGLALHPQWATRKELFVSYTRTGRGGGNPLISVISRFRSSDNGATFPLSGEERLLELDQPFDNHNGGGIAFGPDGFLYIGFGDGGSGNDPNNAGQQLNTLHGKMLRIDVDVPFVSDGGARYGIPSTNPYAATGAPCNQTTSSRTIDAGPVVRCAEIYAYGLRNPWRWSFDRDTGDLWVGDVGQSTWEEIDLVTLGGNYGWRTCEGFHRTGSTSTRCATAGLIDPVAALNRSQSVSVTGGYVYRGSAVPSLFGQFVFADTYNSSVYVVSDHPTLGRDGGVERIATAVGGLGSFGQTLDGEVFMLSLNNGQLFRFQAASTDAGVPFPATLSQTGCFTPTLPTQPVPALIPYTVNAALWSDGAAKERFFAIPDGARITVQADGDFELPNGSVTVKTFSLNGQKIETRLFVRHSDGQWAGYTYEWRTDQSDADLLPGSKTKTVGTQTWTYPSRGECLTCHTAVAGRTLGLELAQLNGALAYPRGVTANQVESLAAVGYFAGALPGPVASLPRLPDPFGAMGTVEERARAYLHANCSGCHRNGQGQGPADFRYGLSFLQTNLCNRAPSNGNAGVAGALIFTPMNPSQSLLSIRTKALDTFRMPPLGSAIVDAQGTALIDAWINSVNACP
ncbi:MAG: PQQ-dependent sugar dehydrogenase [Myxococcus sp.]|nr:PQQ-dependent sugar dehydrogenase [Myxococcus sp.]